MTLILGIVENQKVIMGADNLVTSYPNSKYPLLSLCSTKLFRGPNFIIGYSGHFSVGNRICRELVNNPLPELTNDVSNDLELLRKILLEVHDLSFDKNCLTSYLIGYAGALYEASWANDITMQKHIKDYAYIGAMAVCNKVLCEDYPNGFWQKDMIDIFKKVSENNSTVGFIDDKPMILTI